jgi:hypothetical protein
MSSREERRQQQIERLLDRLEAAAMRWAEAEHQEGLDSGRHGVVSAGLRKRRDQAALKVKDILQELRQATKRRPTVR